jgi:hypothetical protein
MVSMFIPLDCQFGLYSDMNTIPAMQEDTPTQVMIRKQICMHEKRIVRTVHM